MARARDEIAAAVRGEGPLGRAAVEDEPVFVLRARDVLASRMVNAWAWYAEGAGVDADKVREARAIAAAMETWPNRKVPD